VLLWKTNQWRNCQLWVHSVWSMLLPLFTCRAPAGERTEAEQLSKLNARRFGCINEEEEEQGFHQSQTPQKDPPMSPPSPRTPPKSPTPLPCPCKKSQVPPGTSPLSPKTRVPCQRVRKSPQKPPTPPAWRESDSAASADLLRTAQGVLAARTFRHGACPGHSDEASFAICPWHSSPVQHLEPQSRG